MVGSSGTRALQVVDTSPDRPTIDLTEAVEWLRSEDGRVNVLAARGYDGIARRMEVQAREGSNTWVVFALSNASDEKIDRLIVAPRYRSLGAGLLWPDLGHSHIVGMTSSAGDPPEREDSATADVFRITLNPGTVTTFVVEMRNDDLPQLYLWEPAAYNGDSGSLPLGSSAVIGIVGLLALVISLVVLSL